jgi:hypothetical protein
MRTSATGRCIVAFNTLIFDNLAKSLFWLFTPAEAGIKSFQDFPRIPDTRFRGYDDF